MKHLGSEEEKKSKLKQQAWMDFACSPPSIFFVSPPLKPLLYSLCPLLFTLWFELSIIFLGKKQPNKNTGVHWMSLFYSQANVFVHAQCSSAESVFIFLGVCASAQVKETAVKRRTGISKGFEAETQQTCWQSLAKPILKWERKERGGSEGGSRGKRAGLRSGSANTPSTQPSVWAGHAGGSMCYCAL